MTILDNVFYVRQGLVLYRESVTRQPPAPSPLTSSLSADNFRS